MLRHSSDDEPGYRRGVSWYRRELNFEKSFTNRRVFLHFEGANHVAEVFINGKFVGKHIGGYTAPPDLDIRSNKFVIVYGRAGRIWAQSRSGGIFVQTKISGSGKDGLPQIMLSGLNSVVTFARSRTSEGVYKAEGYH